MKILMAASEVAPFSKTGGLADVVGALPNALADLGHDVRIVTPMHGGIDFSKYALSRPTLESLGVPMGGGDEWCAVHEAKLPGGDVPVYFLEHERYWQRKSIYTEHDREYSDNAERFAFLSRAALQLCKLLQWAPDVVHAHDWMTALAPVFLKTHYRLDPLLAGAASVLTIHNVGYQGEFPKHDLARTGFGWDVFTPGGLEFHDRLNFLKGGVLYADKVSTVSPTYAWEITTPVGGSGLDGALRARSPDLVGIINGLDYREWNPAADKHLPATFDVDDLAGKARCKEALQEEYGLPVRADVPVVGMVSRLAYQKGVDVLAAALPALMRMDLQFVVLGSGEIWTHFVYGDLPNRYPGKAGAFIGFDNAKAHRVYAGSDLFLMPSRYEPCGLGQLSAKRYGSLPIVRRTGGLNDTVTSFDEYDGTGDGFSFSDLTPLSIANTVGWATATWYDRPETFAKLRERGMRDRFDWEHSAKRYVDLYRWAVERRHAA